MPAGVVCSGSIVGSALGEVKPVLKPSGRVFFMEQVLAPDPDRKLRPYRLDILKPLQQANSDSCHLNRGVLSSTCSSNCSCGTECGRQVSKMHGSIAIDISACKLQPEVVTRRLRVMLYSTTCHLTRRSTTCHLTCRLTEG